MHTETLRIGGTTPGLTIELTVLHYGEIGAQPKVYVQAGLHADEAPGHLVAHHLRRRLDALEADGAITGHIVLVPAANPIGLAQTLMGSLHGRFALEDGQNFNRGFPELTEAVAHAVADRLGDDAGTNAALIRAALIEAVTAWPVQRPADRLKQALLLNAIDADTVLDLHCDGEARMHLYTLSGQEEAFRPLTAALGAEAVLVAEVSGANPFDEAVSRPWAELAARFPARPMPPGAIAATVELRGQADVSHDLAAKDAAAILDFLARRGALATTPAPLPNDSCAPTPLTGSEALEAPSAGLIVYACPMGERVEPGRLIAEIIDPVSGEATPVRATTAGVFYARTSARFAVPGRRLGKIAGIIPFRTGPLLSP